MTTASNAGLVGRLAPSPTGALHLGNARTFLLAWLSIRSRGGTLLLRLEDIDGPRVKPAAVAQTIEDLRWLGLDWDGGILLQSTRGAAYQQAIDRLAAAGRLYPCVCTRAEIDEAASAPHEMPGGEPVYPGTCRGRFVDAAAALAATGRAPALRFAVDVPAVSFDDGFVGACAGAVCGDFVVQKRDRGAAYQLAVVVDDAFQGVTEVLRADDLLPSTPRQLLLYQALGLRPPRFVHVPLVVGGDGRRLAKRHGDTSLRAFRARGIAPTRIVAALARWCGLSPVGDECTPRELLSQFDLRRLPRQPVRGDDLELR